MFLIKESFNNIKKTKLFKRRLPTAIAFTFLFPSLVFAYSGIEITEIMYDLNGSDTGREWVEIYNGSENSINITDWKFFENDTNHRINSEEEGGETKLEPDMFAVLADNPEKFREDNPSFSGLLFDSAFSLKNTGEEIILRDPDLVDVSSVSYIEHSDIDEYGYSIQKINDVWVESAPTPGALNSQSESSEDQDDNQNQDQSEEEENEDENSEEPQNPSSEYIDFPEEQQIYADAGSDLEAVAGAGFFFEGKAYGIKKEPLEGAHYSWSFGDGSVGNGKKPMHHYDYPGVYIAFLRVSSGEFMDTDRVKVFVSPADIQIKDANSDFIELRNGLNKELDLSRWHLRADNKHFTFPQNTIILPKSNIRFSFSVTKLKSKKGKVFLLYPNGDIATSTSPLKKEFEKKDDEIIVKTSSESNLSQETNKNKKTISDSATKNTFEKIDKNEDDFKLSQDSASAFGTVYNLKGGEKSELKWLLALITFIGISSITALSVHKKMKDKNSFEFAKENELKGEDIEIID